MYIENSFDKLEAVIKKNRESINTTTKEERDKAFWKAAVECFNEEIAGDITLIDGRVIHVAKLEYVEKEGEA